MTDNNDEILTCVNEKIRSDGTVAISDDEWGSARYALNISDGVKIAFEAVDTYNISHGEEWASLARDGKEVAFISSREDVEIPHWVFEELVTICEKDQLRDTTEYCRKYSVKDKYDMGR